MADGTTQQSDKQVLCDEVTYLAQTGQVQFVKLMDGTTDGTSVLKINSDGTLDIATEAQADYDTGAGTVNLSMIGLALPASGGPVAGGTSTNPLRIDPTGTTTQPISASSLPLPTGAATSANQTTIIGHIDGVESSLTTIAGTLTSMIKAEDSAHSSGDGGFPALAVRNDVSGSLVGADGDYAPLQVDSSGFLRTRISSGTTSLFPTEDSAHSSGDQGVMTLAVRKDTATQLAGTDGDYSPLINDASGRLWVSAVQSGIWNITDISGTVSLPTGASTAANQTTMIGYIDGLETTLGTVSTNITDIVKAEDAAHSSGDKGVMSLGVRQDSNSSLAGSSGDYAPFQLDSNGFLKVTVPINTTTFTRAEDAVHSSGDVGVMSLAVRHDAGGSLVSADGDYTALTTDSSGNLRVNVAAGGAGDGAILDGVSSSIKATVLDYTNSNPLAVRLTDTSGDYVGAGAGTQYTEDAAAAADPVGTMVMAVRADSPAAVTSADGDNVAARATNKGELYVKHIDAIPVTDNSGSLTVDNAGTFAVQATQSGTWNIGSVTTLPGQYAEDSAHNSGDIGTFVLGVRSGSLSALAGANGDYIPFMMNTSGELHVYDSDANTSLDSIETQVTNTSSYLSSIDSDTGSLVGLVKAEDAAHSTGDTGVMALSRRIDAAASSAGASGDYATLNTDANGRLWCTSVIDTALPAGTNNIGDVDVLSVVPGTGATSLGKAEDAAHTTGDTGVMALAVRSNTAASTSGADGDYQPLITNTTGHLWVDASGQTLTVGSHHVTNAGTFATQSAITAASGSIASGAIASGALAAGSIAAGAVAAGASSFVKLEDAANADQDAGVPAMMVRKATPANLSGTDGDYEFLQGSAGRLWTSSTIDAALPAGTNAIGKLAANSGVDIGDVDVTTVGTITPGTAATSLGKAEDAAHASGDVGVMALAVRSNTAASTSGADGDYQPLITNTTGHLWVDASGQTLSAAGAIAHDAADSGNPLKIGAQARTTNPTAVADADRVNVIADDVGRIIVTSNQCRDLTEVQQTTITSSTSETTIVTAAGSGVFADLLSLTITNSSATALIVTLKDSTTGTTRGIYALAANGGITIPFHTPLKQATANNNWTLTCGTSVASIYVVAQYAKNV